MTNLLSLTFWAGSLAITASTAMATDYTAIHECGFRITEPGRYKVEDNLFCDPADAFAIAIQNTHHVELDLQGYQLRMPGGQQHGIGIYFHNSHHVEVKAEKEAFIYNFQTAISFYGYQSGGEEFENREVEIHGNGMRLLNNRLGVLVKESRDIELKKLRTQNNGKDWSLLQAKDVEFDDVNLPANSY